MYEILTAVQAIVILITILGCIPYGIWIVYTMIRKRWRLAGKWTAIPVLFYSLLFGVSWFLQSRIETDYQNNLYDCEVTLGPAIYEYNSDRSFNGDGYSLSVHALPPVIKKRFESADAKLLGEYPKHPSYRNHWNFEHWREAPFDDGFNDYLDFALSSYDSGEAPELKTLFLSIRKALARKGTYYAFFHYRPGGYIGDIDFFIVDLNEGRLYSINHNT